MSTLTKKKFFLSGKKQKHTNAIILLSRMKNLCKAVSKIQRMLRHFVFG